MEPVDTPVEETPVVVVDPVEPTEPVDTTTPSEESEESTNSKWYKKGLDKTKSAAGTAKDATVQAAGKAVEAGSAVASTVADKTSTAWDQAVNGNVSLMMTAEPVEETSQGYYRWALPLGAGMMVVAIGVTMKKRGNKHDSDDYTMV